MLSVPDTKITDTTASTPVTVYSDASSAESGACMAGWVVCTHTGEPIAKHAEQLGVDIGSAQAETDAIRRAVRGLAHTAGIDHAIIYTDSKAARETIDMPTLSAGFDSLSVEWIPRSENWLADMVVDTALRRGEPHTPTASRTTFGITD